MTIINSITVTIKYKCNCDKAEELQVQSIMELDVSEKAFVSCILKMRAIALRAIKEHENGAN